MRIIARGRWEYVAKCAQCGSQLGIETRDGMGRPGKRACAEDDSWTEVYVVCPVCETDVVLQDAPVRWLRAVLDQLGRAG